MNEERYFEISNNADYTTFKFVSHGRSGSLTKIVRFDEIRDNTFNLALGTILSNGDIDFITTTNNGDRNKVLLTVAGIVYRFMEKHPEKNVYIKGSDNRRTLLYQRAIAYGYEELIQSFNIYGEILIENQQFAYEFFDKTKSYFGFLIERK